MGALKSFEIDMQSFHFWLIRFKDDDKQSIGHFPCPDVI